MSEYPSQPGAASHPADTGIEELVERAFHYRGDVTIRTDDRGSLTGYLFNRNTGASEPYAQLFETSTGQEVCVPYQTITDVQFTGRDAAAASAERFEAFQDRQERPSRANTQAK